MGIITRMLKETVVYWAPLLPDANGQPTYDLPVELAARWEEDIRDFIDIRGADEFSDLEIARTKVFVASDVEPGGVLMLGQLTSSVNTLDPKANDNAWEIKRFTNLPKLNLSERLRTAYL